MRRWARRGVPAALLAVFVSLMIWVGESSVSTWMEQNRERSRADHDAAVLDGRIAELEQEIRRRTSDEAVRREALCFGPYVEPGTEVYTIVGLRGCVEPAALR